MTLYSIGLDFLMKLSAGITISLCLQVSGMPTFCLPTEDGGVGFDYRLHMAIADKWIEILK